MSLNDLAKRNDQFLQMAFAICKNKETAKDMVQDMYIRVHELGKEVNDGYIWFMLRSIFINEIRLNKKMPIADIELSIIKEIDQADDNVMHQLLDAMDKLRPIEKLILEGEQKYGQKKYSQKSGISPHIIRTKRKKIIEQLKKELCQSIRKK